MADQQRKIPAPDPNPETLPFWQAAQRGELVTRKCRSCTKLHYYPRASCPYCGADDTQWVRLSGRGEVYAFSIMRAAPVPYVIAYIRLAEGVTMLSNVVHCAFEQVKIGMPVQVTFQPHEGDGVVPLFEPAARMNAHADTSSQR